MKRILFIMLAVVLALAPLTPLFAADYESGDKVTTTGGNTMKWRGQGATDGALDDTQCGGEEGDCYVAPGDGYLLWIFTYDGGEQVFDFGVTPYLVLGGTGSGTYYPCKAAGNEFHFVTEYYTPDSDLTAVIYFYTVTTGNGAYNLVISHGCSGCIGCLEITKELSIPTGCTPAAELDGTFTINVAGPYGFNQDVPFEIEDGEIVSDNPVTLCELAPGTYTISEGEMPLDWRAPDLPIEVEVQCDETTAVTVINEYQGPCERLEVRKTVVTSYTRTHDWSIDKTVDTEFGYEENNLSKIWLFVDGHGDETATWTIDVTYEGYEDSGFKVCGEVIIENTGGPEDVPAVVTGAVDELCGEPITVMWPEGVEFPYTLEVGESLTGTYCVELDGKTGDDCFNVVTVTTGRNVYTAREKVEWGDPDQDTNAEVEITDTNPEFAEKYGEVILNAYDYEAGDVVTFTYTKDFAWADYGAENCGDYQYDNIAKVVAVDGTVLDSDDATLLVNVQCYIYQTAYAYGGEGIATCFMPTFANWGWTNKILPGTYTWDLWAGAGQCDPTKGTLVGSVTVVYDATTRVVTVTYNVGFPFDLDRTYVYAGKNQWPTYKSGKKDVPTVAPGQYTNQSPFLNGNGAPLVWVIAHAKVGIPDPTFGPPPIP